MFASDNDFPSANGFDSHAESMTTRKSTEMSRTITVITFSLIHSLVTYVSDETYKILCIPKPNPVTVTELTPFSLLLVDIRSFWTNEYTVLTHKVLHNEALRSANL